MLIYNIRRLVLIGLLFEQQETVQTKTITQPTKSDKSCGNQEQASQGAEVLFDVITQQHQETQVNSYLIHKNNKCFRAT